MNSEAALLAHHQLSLQIFESRLKADTERIKLDIITALMAGETALHASGPIDSDAMYRIREDIYVKPEIPRHPEDHVIGSTCELVMVGSVQSCQHGILCKERK